MSTLNERLSDEEVAVTLSDESRFIVEHFHCDRDSATWEEQRDGNVVKVPISRIHLLSTEPDRLGTGLIGLAAGAFAGGMIGMLVDSGHESAGPGLLGARLGVVVGVGAGGMIGAVTGFATSHSSEYRFGSDNR